MKHAAWALLALVTTILANSILILAHKGHGADMEQFDVTIYAFKKDGTVEKQRVPMGVGREKAEAAGQFLAKRFKEKFPEYEDVQAQAEPADGMPPEDVGPEPYEQGT